ncbi:glycosyltransferase [Ruania alba]|uniref:Glycosyl transferases group 1 n=1 Tax=Ruania alba TaxID=648782 RepID=A0A1H5NBQ6_9MICO|nr:glycosyltransferase [Ruania alba]SEE98301.1 Glycosyl transferases group 1 [Ruania alba]
MRQVAERRRRELTTARVHADHAVFAQRDPRDLPTTLLRTKSLAGREILAHLASFGHLNGVELEAFAGGTPARHAVSNRLDPTWTTEYARVRALQQGSPADHEVAVALMATVERTWGRAALGAHLDLYLQLLVRLHRREAAAELLGAADLDIDSQHRAAALTDLLNPFLRGGPDDIAAWTASLSEAVLRPGVPSLSLQDAPGSPFDRLQAVTDTVTHDPHRITVITSCFNPGPELLTTVRSVIAQTWQNWEMLIVDDASGAASTQVLAEVAALDPRIRVIRKSINGGTYRARNTALRQATGDFVVTVDSDDWVHPTYLETGVRPLLKDRSLLATRGWGVRISEMLELTRPGYRPLMTAAPSLMFRLAEVVGRIGFFDPVRKAADTEFARRLEAACGKRIKSLPRAALTFLRGGETTLSASDFSAGWRHTSRRAYRGAYEDWHRRIAAGKADPFLEPDGPRRFPTPRRWSTGRAHQVGPRPVLDVVFAGDWRRHGGPQNSMLEEIAACRAAGMRVGVMHLEAMRFMTRRDDPLCAPLRELIRDGAVEWVHVDDDVAVRTLVLRYPPILQYPPAVSGAVRPDNLLIVANQAPCEPDGSDQRYVPQDVTAHATALFETAPRWVPQGPTVRELLTEMDPGISLTPWDSPGLVDAETWHVRTPRPIGDPPVVGRYSRDTGIKFPESAEHLLTAYGFGPEVEVRMMGAANTVRRLLRDGGRSERPPSNWTLLQHKARDVREFLADLDVFLYLDNAHANEAFGRVILEAAASGVLTIASPKHQPTFGDAVLYAEPEEAVALTRRYLADPELYAEQVQRSRALVDERFSHASFVARLRELATERAGSARHEGSAGAVEREATAEVALELHFDARRPWRDPVLIGAPELVLQQERVRSDADAGRCDTVYLISRDPCEHPGVALAPVLHRIDDDQDVRPEDLPDGAVAAVIVRGAQIEVTSRPPLYWSDRRTEDGALVVCASSGDGTGRHLLDRRPVRHTAPIHVVDELVTT